MKPLLLNVIAFVILLLVSFAQATAQRPMIFMRLVVSDNGDCVDTLYFGLDTSATSCIDTLFNEYELPPIPPTGVCDIRFGGTGCFGIGGKIDVQHLDPSNPENIFKVIFQPGDGGFPFHFCWTALSGTGLLSSVALMDPFGFGIINVNMLTDGCSDLTNSAFTNVLIKTHLNVEDVKTTGSFPDWFGLRENYPNPFNPSTTLRYDVREYAYVELEVRDLPGRLVKRLVARDLTPATYSVVWDGTDESGRNAVSGVYYVRMTASPHSSAGRSTPFQATRKLMLVR